ncbi:MAG: hypothetical protein WCQ95_04190 [Bacteroidota bacterium]
MRNIRQAALYLIILALILVSCKKQSDTFAPQITITTPYENQQYVVNDSIHILANVCDDRKLQSIDISVTDASFVSVLTLNTINPPNNCIDINTNLVIDNYFLPTGNYYLVIKAWDGTNETKKFQKININAVPKKLKYVIVVTKASNTIHINKIDSTNAIIPVATLAGDYCGSDVSSNAQQFYIAGRYHADVSVFSTIDWQLQWNIPVIVNPPFPYFEAIAVYNSQLYVSYRQGKFEMYNQSGSIRASRDIDYGNFPKKFLLLNKYLITYEQSPSAADKQFVVYFTPSYSIKNKLLITFQVQNLFIKNDDNCILFSNYNNQGTAKLFTISTHTFFDSYTFSDGPIVSSTQIDVNNYLVLAADGVYWYDYQTTSNVMLNTAQNSQTVVYDEMNSDYYYSENYFTLKKRSFPSAAIQATLNFPDTIINILPVYNRD